MGYNSTDSRKQELQAKSMPQRSSSLAKRIFKFVLMTIGLGVLGIVFAVIGALIGGKVLGSNSVGFADLGLAIGGVIIGYPSGIIVGIISIRKILHQQGSLLLGILGSIIGAVITMVLAEPLNLNSNTNLLFGVFFLSVPVFCLVGFFLKR
ncbi:hypothetical protein ACFLVE_02780 [Chloroflexota bacterium]